MKATKILAELTEDKCWPQYNRLIGDYILFYSQLNRIDLNSKPNYPPNSMHYMMADLFQKLLTDFFDKPDGLYQYVNDIIERLLKQEPISFKLKALNVFYLGFYSPIQTYALTFSRYNKAFTLQKLQAERCVMLDAIQANPSHPAYQRLEAKKQVLLDYFQTAEQATKRHRNIIGRKRLEEKVERLESELATQQRKIDCLESQLTQSKDLNCLLVQDAANLKQEVCMLELQLNQEKAQSKGLSNEIAHLKLSLAAFAETAILLEQTARQNEVHLSTAQRQALPRDSNRAAANATERSAMAGDNLSSASRLVS